MRVSIDLFSRFPRLCASRLLRDRCRMVATLVLAWMFGAGLSATAGAQTGTSSPATPWPTKPVRLVAVFPPGGSVDQVARILAAQLTQQTGQQFFVENRAGASGTIGTAAVAQAAPDGMTLGVVFDTHGVNPSLIPSLPYNTLRDLSPVMLVGTAPMAIVTHASQPWRSFREVLAAVKAKPGSVSYGTVGSGSLGHLAMTQIGNLIGSEFNHVPYRGGGPLMTDAVGNQVPLAIGTVFLVNPHVRSGKLRALAVTSETQDAQMPGVPTVSEEGVSGFQALAWWGIVAPAGVPAPLMQRIVAEVQRAVRTPAVAEKLTAQGMDIRAEGPEVLDRFLRAEIDRWAKVVRDNRIKAGD